MAEENQNDANNEEVAEVSQPQQSFSSVSVASKQKKFIFVLLVLIAGFAVYYFLLSGDTENGKKKKKPVDKAQQEQILQNAKAVPENKKEFQTKVDKNEFDNVKAPEVEAPSPPPPPPPPPPTPAALPPPPPVISDSNDNNNAEDNKPAKDFNPFSDSKKDEEKRQMAIKAKMQTSIMVSGGGGSGGLLGKDDKKKDDTSKGKKNDGFLGFGDGKLDGETLAASSFGSVQATVVNNLNRTILQGKVVSAVLETAINTDIPGMLRAVIGRDIYAERGIDVMIPKGSRLVGKYDSSVKNGQTRVAIMWDRLIRPDGIDIAINSAGVDELGRAGIAANIYDHFWQKIGNAFLVSYIIPIASAEIAKKATKLSTANKDNPASKSTSKNADGSITITTTGGDPVSEAITNSTQEFSGITKGMIKNSFSDKPTLTINQGTVINIYPSQIKLRILESENYH